MADYNYVLQRLEDEIEPKNEKGFQNQNADRDKKVKDDKKRKNQEGSKETKRSREVFPIHVSYRIIRTTPKRIVSIILI